MVAAKLCLLLASVAAVEGSPQLLCFGAKWCEPCQKMGPTLERLSKEGYPLRKVDVDKYGELARRYEVSVVPAFVLIDGKGRKVDQISEATDYTTLRRFFAHYHIAPTTSAATVRGQAPQASAVVFADSAVSQVGFTSPVKNQSNTTEHQSKSLASTVRISVEDGEGHSYGTGTVLDVHGQEALVLTCGHIFRASAGKGRILIERFDSQTAEPTTGTLISFDEGRDVGLLSMKLTRPIQVARLASGDYKAQPGDKVYSVGCNQGAPPTIVDGAINQINKYLGPANITASGRPVVGRSGGGLFNANGELIGVCSAADPEIDEGLYAALPRVFYELDRNGLAFVYRQPDEQPLAEVASTAGIPNLQTSENNNASPVRIRPVNVPDSEPTVPRVQTPAPQSRSKELVCVLKNEDGTQSQAYIVKEPSRELMKLLQREAQQRP